MIFGEFFLVLIRFFHIITILFDFRGRKRDSAAAADDLVSDWNGLKNCLYIFGIDISYPGKHRYGMRTVDAVLIKGARSFRAKEQQTYLTVAFPATIPVILTGCS